MSEVIPLKKDTVKCSFDATGFAIMIRANKENKSLHMTPEQAEIVFDYLLDYMFPESAS